MRPLSGQLYIYTHIGGCHQTEARLYILKISSDEDLDDEDIQWRHEKIYYQYYGRRDINLMSQIYTAKYDVFLSYFRGYTLYDIGDTTWVSEI